MSKNESEIRDNAFNCHFRKYLVDSNRYCAVQALVKFSLTFLLRDFIFVQNCESCSQTTLQNEHN
jgi:hypothetical protein